MHHPYTLPTLNSPAFHCPHCNTFAKQDWYLSGLYDIHNHNPVKQIMGEYLAVICTHCDEPSYWLKDQMIFPYIISAPEPNHDLPGDIKADFEEARQIASASPRGAAALLRLIIQKICIHLGEKGKDLSKDIGNLVKKGLSPKIQKALDVVRVVGNESVHPGKIDLNDTPETASKLFKLVNITADTMISQPKEVDALYEDLIPDSKKEAIDKRDGNEKAQD